MKFAERVDRLERKRARQRERESPFTGPLDPKKLTRAEKVMLAHWMRDDGKLLREIAAVLQMSYTGVQGYLADPFLERQKERRKKYQTKCERCGKKTKGASSYTTPTRWCLKCARIVRAEMAAADPTNDRRYWTRRRILKAIRAYHAEHGRPPVSTDWNRNRKGGPYPNARHVQEQFGSWNAGIKAAGFKPTPIGVRRRNPRGKDLARLLAAGVPVLEELKGRPEKVAP